MNEAGKRPLYHAREIWWCAVGVNVDNEFDGMGNEHDRPILIIRLFNAETLFGVALIGHLAPWRSALTATFRRPLP